MTITDRPDYRARLARVLEHLHDHLDETATLRELADVAHFSPHHFHRIFTGMMGESVGAYVRRLKLERAAYRLRTGKRPVVDMALEAGFASHEAFTRAFRARYGMSPSAFRRTAAPPGTSRTDGWPAPVRLPARTKETTMDVDVITLERMRMAYVRHTGPYAACGQAWEALCAWAGPQGLLGPDTVFVGRCHDDPQCTAPDNIRYDACLILPEHAAPTFEPGGPVGLGEIGGKDYAVTRHLGPYEKMAATYDALCGVWAPDSGRELAAEASLEFYRNPPDTTPPEELITDIHVALEPV